MNQYIVPDILSEKSENLQEISSLFEHTPIVMLYFAAFMDGEI